MNLNSKVIEYIELRLEYLKTNDGLEGILDDKLGDKFDNMRINIQKSGYDMFFEEVNTLMEMNGVNWDNYNSK